MEDPRYLIMTFSEKPAVTAIESLFENTLEEAEALARCADETYLAVVIDTETIGEPVVFSTHNPQMWDFV